LRKKNTILWLFILLKFSLQYLLINPVYDLHRDEYLHLDQAKHLAWGYLSVPPLTSWISYIILHMGNTVFLVKFFPALFGALTLIVVWKTIEELKGGLFAFLVGASAVTFSVILRVNILYQPNSLDILCWTSLYFTLLKYINSEKRRWLWVAAFTCAIGFLNKYNVGFLLLGLLPALCLTEQRKFFINKHFYFSLAFMLLLVSPNIAWQIMHGFPVRDHMEDLAATQLANIHRADFLKEQLLFFIGSVYIWLAALLSFFIYPPFRKYRVFFWSFIFTLLLYVYLQSKGYYAVGLYPVLLAFGSVYLEHLLKNGWKRFLQPLVIAVILAAFLPFLKVAFPVMAPPDIEKRAKRFQKLDLLRWEDGKDHSLPQDFADMLGWRELASSVDSIFDGININTIVLCDNYGEAGAINYYTRHSNLNAVSFNADYIDWFQLQTPISNMILISEKENKSVNHYKPLFNKVTLTGSIKNKFAREYGTSIYLMESPNTSINKFLAREILQHKQH